MSLTKSHLGTPYNFAPFDFAMSEKERAVILLTRIWVVDEEKTSVASEFLLEDETLEAYLRPLAMVIFHEVLKSTPTLPEVTTNRQTGNRYRRAFELSAIMSRFHFLQGALLGMRMRYDNYPDVRREMASRGPSEVSLWRMADLLFEFSQTGERSIYSPEFQTLLADEFKLEE